MSKQTEGGEAPYNTMIVYKKNGDECVESDRIVHLKV